MKKTILFTIVTMMVAVLFSVNAYADDGETRELPTVIKPDPNSDNDPTLNPTPDPIDPPDLKPIYGGHKLPSRPVIITITDGEGVIIPGVDNEDVISYSIYNEDGMLIAMYDDDMDFASAVFSMTGVIEIRIALDGYSLCGWMEL